MHDVARLSENERKDLFRETAQQIQVHEAIIEKDFWVCWILDYLFHESPWKGSLAFKGGTSLSKAFGVIERFSEDIDLILDWKQIGYAEDDPWADRTSTQQDKFGKKAKLVTAQFLSNLVTPQLREDLARRLESVIEVDVVGQDILITYPRAFSLEAILPQVRLEIGPLAEAVPNAQREIRPFAAERFPHLFKRPSTTAKTVLAERTFWEKATILHQEAHRATIDRIPPRLSRHYYDLFRLNASPVKAAALADMSLLERVAHFKMKFYRCPWAKYEEARPGSLRLVPPDDHVRSLTRDYDSMQAMLFGSIPNFHEIMDALAALQVEINGRPADH